MSHNIQREKEKEQEKKRKRVGKREKEASLGDSIASESCSSLMHLSNMKGKEVT